MWNLLVGKAPEEGDIVLQSNDYLCLSGNQEIAEAQISALRDQGGDSIDILGRKLGMRLGGHDIWGCVLERVPI